VHSLAKLNPVRDVLEDHFELPGRKLTEYGTSGSSRRQPSVRRHVETSAYDHGQLAEFWRRPPDGSALSMGSCRE